MFCPKCGASLKEGAAFCSNCGRKIMQKENSSSSSAAEQAVRSREPQAEAAEKNKKPQSASAAPQKKESASSAPKLNHGAIGILIAAAVILVILIAVLHSCSSGDKSEKNGSDVSGSSTESALTSDEVSAEDGIAEISGIPSASSDLSAADASAVSETYEAESGDTEMSEEQAYEEKQETSSEIYEEPAAEPEESEESQVESTETVQELSVPYVDAGEFFSAQELSDIKAWPELYKEILEPIAEAQNRIIESNDDFDVGGYVLSEDTLEKAGLIYLDDDCIPELVIIRDFRRIWDEYNYFTATVDIYTVREGKAGLCTSFDVSGTGDVNFDYIEYGNVIRALTYNTEKFSTYAEFDADYCKR